MDTARHLKKKMDTEFAYRRQGLQSRFTAETNTLGLKPIQNARIRTRLGYRLANFYT